VGGGFNCGIGDSQETELARTRHSGHDFCDATQAQPDMHSESDATSYRDGLIEVMGAGQSVGLPPPRRSLAAVRNYLEGRALEQQQSLWSRSVEWGVANSSGSGLTTGQSLPIVGETVGLHQMPLELIESAIQLFP
jgi:hypothetical protein